MSEHFDRGSLAIIVVTFVLFAAALLAKGLTRDLFLETGVFLVSVKLIVMAYKNSATSKEVMEELRAIREMLEEKKG
ncbi:MAG TPA: hypothetical protein G4O00_12480 [Thermoflexia bacterium]|nr:hypothetical protein [Thermoflexia bacterium]